MLTGAKIVYTQKTRSPKSAQQGVVLLEALIAILLFSMGVLAVVGLQAAMIKNTADSKYRADAAYIAQQRIGMMWSDPANLADYLEDNTDISELLPAGQRSVTQSAPGQFTVTVTWQQPGGGETQHNFTTTARITGG
ncbi:MAG: prepilin-type cleavage/methylation domain-containing protein [Burkholderiales bacterium]|nr:prepilin-type cleavage/methylation domain-containing protein [Burkholderiales bacterium]